LYILLYIILLALLAHAFQIPIPKVLLIHDHLLLRKIGEERILLAHIKL
jgi:hypothetical protein